MPQLGNLRACMQDILCLLFLDSIASPDFENWLLGSRVQNHGQGHVPSYIDFENWLLGSHVQNHVQNHVQDHVPSYVPSCCFP